MRSKAPCPIRQAAIRDVLAVFCETALSVVKESLRPFHAVFRGRRENNV